MDLLGTFSVIVKLQTLRRFVSSSSCDPVCVIVWSRAASCHQAGAGGNNTKQNQGQSAEQQNTIKSVGGGVAMAAKHSDIMRTSAGVGQEAGGMSSLCLHCTCLIMYRVSQKKCRFLEK